MQSTHNSEQIFTLGTAVLLAREAEDGTRGADCATTLMAELLHHLGCKKSCKTYSAKQLS